MYSILTLSLATCSLRKWYFMGICFEFECIIGFFEILIALVLSQMIEIGRSYSTLISSSVFFIQITCVKHDVAAIYSYSIVDKETKYCFLLNQETRLFPRKNATPLVLFLHQHCLPNRHMYTLLE
jgi:hypothetical protein